MRRKTAHTASTRKLPCGSRHERDEVEPVGLGDGNRPAERTIVSTTSRRTATTLARRTSHAELESVRLAEPALG